MLEHWLFEKTPVDVLSGVGDGVDPYYYVIQKHSIV
jgi:hypothetical protein